MKLNLGGNTSVPDGWINVNYALGLRFYKIPFFRFLNRKIKLFNHDWSGNYIIHDLRHTFPWPDSSVNIIYSSHTLEHFSKTDGRRLLEDCYRVLRNNGILRIVVPDLGYIMQEYIEKRISADDFLERLGVLYPEKNNMFKKILLPIVSFPHKCMYDRSCLIKLLNEIGFDSSVKITFDSRIEDIRLIELEERTKTSVIIEALKR